MLVLKKIVALVKEKFGVLPYQKTLKENFAISEKLKDKDLQEEYNAKTVLVSESMRLRDLYDHEHNADKLFRDVESLIDFRSTVEQLDEVIAEIPGSYETRKRLGQIQLKNRLDNWEAARNMIVERDRLMTRLGTNIDQLVTETLTTFMGVQPMSGPVDAVHYLTHGKSSSNPTQINLQVLRGVVEAKSRKLNTQLEMQSDLDFSISESIAVGNATRELVHGIFSEYVGLQKYVETSKATSWLELLTEINREAMDIPKATRRGAGNRVVVPTRLAELMQSYCRAELEYKPEKEKGLIGFVYIGSSMNMDFYSSDTVSSITILYKGQQEIDAGFFYAPYVPVQSSSVVDIEEGELHDLLTRFGTFEQENVTEYVRKLSVPKAIMEQYKQI